MLVAGSVISMLVMGLAVDAVATPADEDDDGTGPDSGADDWADAEAMDGRNEGLEDMLDAHHAAQQDAAGTAPGLPFGSDWHEDQTAEAHAMEAAADTAWEAQSASGISDLLDVDYVTDLADGSEVAYVDGFQSTTDTLILEFDGSAADAPEITIDHSSEAGAAVILANGLPITLVENAEGMTPEQVRVVMTGDLGVEVPGDGGTQGAHFAGGDNAAESGSAEHNVNHDGHSEALARGEYVDAFELAGNVTDFDPTEDRIEVIYDPDATPEPELSVVDFEDGTGADIMLNGEVILSVEGAQGLDPSAIDLRASA